jgi:hypothetical protein
MPTLIGGDDESAPNPATGLNNAIRQANSASTIGISVQLEWKWIVTSCFYSFNLWSI